MCIFSQIGPLLCLKWLFWGQIFLKIPYIIIYAVDYHHNGFMAIRELGHTKHSYTFGAGLCEVTRCSNCIYQDSRSHVGMQLDKEQ